MRKEHDFLGELEIPDNAYYGVQTMRAMENFQITGYTADPLFIKALGMVKKAAALANMKIGLLDEKIGNVTVLWKFSVVRAAIIIISALITMPICRSPLTMLFLHPSVSALCCAPNNLLLPWKTWRIPLIRKARNSRMY